MRMTKKQLCVVTNNRTVFFQSSDFAVIKQWYDCCLRAKAHLDGRKKNKQITTNLIADLEYWNLRDHGEQHRTERGSNSWESLVKLQCRACPTPCWRRCKVCLRTLRDTRKIIFGCTPFVFAFQHFQCVTRQDCKQASLAPGLFYCGAECAKHGLVLSCWSKRSLQWKRQRYIITDAGFWAVCW